MIERAYRARSDRIRLSRNGTRSAGRKRLIEFGGLPRNRCTPRTAHLAGRADAIGRPVISACNGRIIVIAISAVIVFGRARPNSCPAAGGS